MKKDNEATVEQVKPSGTGAEITPLVIEDLKQRTEIGKQRYGEALRAFNKRKSLDDAYQEVLDLSQYMKQWIIERRILIDSIMDYLHDSSNKNYSKLVEVLEDLGEDFGGP